MNFGWAFANPFYTEFPVPAFQRHFIRYPEAAENLHAAVDDAARGFRCVEFADRCVGLDVVSQIAAPGGTIGQQPRGP